MEKIITKKWTLLTLLLIQFTHILDFMILSPLGPQLSKELSLTPKDFGLLVSSYAIMAGIAGVLTSFLIDRFERKKFLVINYSIFIFCTLGCAISDNNFIGLLIFRILAGLSGGILGSQVMTIATEIYPAQKRGKVIGTIMVGFSLSSILGVPLGLYIAQISHWSFAFYFVFGLSCFVLGLILTQIPALHQIKQTIFPLKKIVQNIFKEKNQYLSLLITFFLILSHFSLIPFVPLFLVKNAGLPENQLQFTYILGGLATVSIFPLIGKLSDRIGSKKILIAFCILSLIPLLSFPRLHQSHWILIYLGSLSYFVLSSPRFVASQTLISLAVKPEHKASFLSINNSFSSFSQGIATFLTGLVLIENTETGFLENYEIIGYFCAGFSLICIWITQKIQMPSNSKT